MMKRHSAASAAGKDRRFLQQYMTLTKCDLYFADKAILVEGATERILMPRISKIVDADLPADSKLRRKYANVMDIMSYDDLLRRLDNVIASLRSRIDEETDI